jgi:hypothetical protein
MSPTPFEMAIRVHEDRYGSLQTRTGRGGVTGGPTDRDRPTRSVLSGVPDGAS